MELPDQRHPNWNIFVCELILYTGLVVVYSEFVLHYLADWLKDLFDHDHRLFAIVALLLMIGQSVGLEMISSFFFAFIRREKK